MKTELTHLPSVLAARRWYDVLDFGSLRGMSLDQWKYLRGESREGRRKRPLWRRFCLLLSLLTKVGRPRRAETSPYVTDCGFVT